jgi:HEAT repeat protein
VLRPLERLFESDAPEVRAAVMRGATKVLIRRTFDLVRRALADPAPAVVDAALQLLRATDFVTALPPMTRIFRESSDERVRLAALEGIGISKDPQGAARVLLDAARQEADPVRRIAEQKLEKLVKVGGDEVATLLRQARDAEDGERRDALDRMLRSSAHV